MLSSDMLIEATGVEIGEMPANAIPAHREMMLCVGGLLSKTDG